ncbi:alpha/beta hydrolase [Kitasatospora sp. NPDC058218]|uniref:alpha/beta hydrolase n=1 Tax=Kitasatospora sp. NPDC058218 TaxID=3346385 RepID=UPI0036DC58CB
MTASTFAAPWNPIDWPLTTGPLPYVVLATGWAALLVLAVGRGRRWWRVRLPSALGTAAALLALLTFVVDEWWFPFPGGIPLQVVGWTGAALLGLSLVVHRMSGLTWRRRLLAIGLGALVALMAVTQVNIGFGQFPTGRVALAPWLTRTERSIPPQVASTTAAPPGRPLSEVWVPPADLPAKGSVREVPIPGSRSGFEARDAYIYLPPAYEATPRPLLPVLILLSGQPGTPGDWVFGGQVNEQLDAFAAEHGGLAPIVVMADQLGSTWNNTLCLDSRIAQTYTYLTVDVPDWIHQNLQTATGRDSWAVGGASMGGTCALQLGVNDPDHFGTVLDISGQDEPTLGTRAETIEEAYGGDSASFDAVDPLQVMAGRKFPDTAVALLVGEDDSEFRPQLENVRTAVLAAGMTTTFELVPGGHGWTVFGTAFEREIPWLARRTGLIG